MSDELKRSVNVDIGIGAKAEVKTEIPSESSGRLLDTLTDIIRPFSERRGLKLIKLDFSVKTFCWKLQ